MGSLEVVAILLSGISISASLFYYANVLQNANQTRRTQMLMELYQAYRDPQFAKAWNEVLDQEYTDFDDHWQKYGMETNRDAWNKWQSVARVFHGIGVLVKRDMVDIDLVEELMGTMIAVSWYRMGPVVLGFRANRVSMAGDDDWWSNKYQSLYGFEYLHNELKKRSQTNP